MQSPEQHNCLLVSIRTNNRDSIFDCYRDYLVFMGLIRDGVSCNQYQVYGFCWIKQQCLLLIKPRDQLFGKHLLRLLQRYHFWLLQRGPSMTEFKLQIVDLKNSKWTLDCLRYLHQQVVEQRIAEDAMDYHWHSHHVYNGFWSVNWLDTSYILELFAMSRIVALNRFRQYMMHPYRLDFKNLLNNKDCSSKYIGSTNKHIAQKQLVAEINSSYHQSLINRTEVKLIKCDHYQLIQINVTPKQQSTETERMY